MTLYNATHSMQANLPTLIMIARRPKAGIALWPMLLVLILMMQLVGCDGGHARSSIVTIDWQTSPLDLNLRGMNGSSYLFRCSPGKPEPSLVTGNGVYTDASSICAAAVHAGAIDSRRGGVVKIQILPGKATYAGSTQNFLRSQDYMHSWGGSFAVLSAVDYHVEKSQ